MCSLREKEEIDFLALNERVSMDIFLPYYIGTVELENNSADSSVRQYSLHTLQNDSIHTHKAADELLSVKNPASHRAQIALIVLAV